MENIQKEYQAFSSTDAGYQKFLQSMHAGHIEPGSSVTQTELCEILDMSMTPLRECLILLEEYGLVEVRPRAGVQIVYPEISFFRSNMQFRTIIEANALNSFIEKSDHKFLHSLRHSHEDCRNGLRTKDDLKAISPELHSLDKMLHTGIVKALHNPSILSAHTRIQDNLGLCKLVHVQLTYRQNLLDTIDEHLILIEAMLKGNIDAAQNALNAHFRASTHRTFT